MKNTTLRRALALLLALMLVLSLAACGSDDADDGKQQDSQTGSIKQDAGKTDTDAPDNKDTEKSYSEKAQAAIDGLYTNQWKELFAASYLGHRDENETTDLVGWLHDNNPAAISFWPFLAEISEEDIIGEYGDLYCIVPMVESAEVTVKSVEWETLGNGMMPHYSDPLYSGEVDRPFLVYISYNDNWSSEPNMVIGYVKDDGSDAEWFPEQQEGYIFCPLDKNGNKLILDFANLYEVGDYVPHLEDTPDADSEWLPPTDMGLAYTTWYSENGWMLVFDYDENADNFSGVMTLYKPVEEDEGMGLVFYFESSWWISYDCLCLGYYNGNCPFPLLISPSGEQLVIMQSEDGSVLPFFEPGQTICGLTLSYN